MAETARRSYEPVAWMYERLAHAFSLGRIRAAKASQVPHLGPGESVLYVGAGSGEDAVLAARQGARITCVDLSPSMLERTRRRIEGAGLRGAFACCDIMEHSPATPYDAVAANFFLNIFPEPVMERVLAHLVGLLRPGGRLLVADFAPPEGNALQRLLQRAYYRSANLTFWAMRLAPLHPIYDYRRCFAGLGLELRETRDFRVFPLGPAAYRSLVAVRAVAVAAPEGPAASPPGALSGPGVSAVLGGPVVE